MLLYSLLLPLLLLSPVRARPTTTSPTTTSTSSSCVRDDLYSSLSRDGGEFCESVIDSYCESVSTPTPYTSYPSDEISSRCECVLTDLSTQTDATEGGAFDHPSTTRYHLPTETGKETANSATSTDETSSGAASIPNSGLTGSASSTGFTFTSTASSGSSFTETASSSTIGASSQSGQIADTSSTSGPSGASLSAPTRSGSRNTTATRSAGASGTAATVTSSPIRVSSLSSGSLPATGSPLGSSSASHSTKTLIIPSSLFNVTGSATTQVMIPTRAQSTGFLNSTATPIPSSATENGISTGSGSIKPSSSGTFSGLSRSASQQSRSWSNTASGLTSVWPMPTASGASATVTSRRNGSWNSTSTASGGSALGTGTTRAPVGSTISSRRTSTDSHLTGPWNSTLTGVPSPSGSGATASISLSSSRTFSGSRTANGTSGITSRSGNTQSSNATMTATGNGAPTVTSTKTASTFTGWNATLSTTRGRGTAAGSGTGVFSGSATTATGNETATAATESPTSESTNSTGVSNTLRPTSFSHLTGTGGSAWSTASGNFTYDSTTLRASATRVGSMTSGTAMGSGPQSPSSGVLISSTGRANITSPTSIMAPTPTLITVSGVNNGGSTISSGENTTVASPTSAHTANFTGVSRHGNISEESCYHLPQATGADHTRRALLQNSGLREINVTVPVPYIESVDFQHDGLKPLFMTVRDSLEGTYYLDISNRSRLAIVDTYGNSMLFDDDGVRFATNSCRYDVNVTISDMYAQLADLSDVDCSFGNGSVPPPPPIKRAEDIAFNQTIFLHDQCSNAVKPSSHDKPVLRVGDTACNQFAVDGVTGRWDFDCTYPGVSSGTLRCQKAVKDDIVDFLIKDPIGGECPDLSTVIATLANTSGDVLKANALRDELYSRADENVDKLSVDVVVDAYEALWTALQEFFTPSRSATVAGATPWKEYISVYNAHRSFEDDICDDLHAGEVPLSLNLRYGASYINPITTLNWAPRPARPYNITVQDPSSLACCPNGRVADNQDEPTCAYPSSAFVGDTGCICGRTANGQSIAYEATECGNFEATCKTDSDCGSDELVCMIGTCCGSGVCVDPYACAQNGTALVTFGGL